MKITLSKNQWESIGKKAGWMKAAVEDSWKAKWKAKKQSDCCGADDAKCEPDKGMTNNFYSDIDMCPKCKKNCKFVNKGKV